MKVKIFIFFLSVGLFATSCKKCRVCTCDTNGIAIEYENCAYGGGSSNETQRTWERMLRENCPQLQCRNAD